MKLTNLLGKSSSEVDEVRSTVVGEAGWTISALGEGGANVFLLAVFDCTNNVFGLGDWSSEVDFALRIDSSIVDWSFWISSWSVG